VPLLLGVAGMAAFLYLQSTNYILEPTMPLRMFANRSSLAGFAMAFLQNMMQNWISYYLPLYFQSCKEASPVMSGVYILPTAIAAMPFSILSGITLSKVGRYRPLQFLGTVCLIVGFGLYSMLDATSSTGFWLGIQFVGAAGIGLLVPTILPAIQAPLEDDDTAVTTATTGFLRSFGGVWGIAIPSAVFNSRVNQLLYRIDDASLQQELVNGGAYAMASRTFMQSLDAVPLIKQQVMGVYVDAQRTSWQVGIGFCGLLLLAVCLIREIPMREHLDTEFGLAAAKEPALLDGAKGANATVETTKVDLEKGGRPT
jgi:hypothetical protein